MHHRLNISYFVFDNYGNHILIAACFKVQDGLDVDFIGLTMSYGLFGGEGWNRTIDAKC
jgi:hypothetical protein